MISLDRGGCWKARLPCLAGDPVSLAAPVPGGRRPCGTRARSAARGPRRPLLRLLRLARPLRGQLLLSVLAGAAATGCGVALLAVSGFLLARASVHPGILAISVAVVAVRAFSVGRGSIPLRRAAGLARRRVPGPG